MVIGIRQRIVEDTDGQSSRAIEISDDEDLENKTRNAAGRVSNEAREKFTDYSASLLCFHDLGSSL